MSDKPSPLRRIEADLRALADADEPADPHELRVIAMRVAAQAEMMEKELADGCP